MDQWKTAVSVTIPTMLSDIHFQKITSSALAWDLTLVLVSMLNICSVRPAAREMRSVYRAPAVTSGGRVDA